MANYLDKNGLKEYDQLIKNYIDNKIEKVFKFLFYKEDWVQIEQSAVYYIDIENSTHEMNKPYVSEYYIKQDNDYKKAIPATLLTIDGTVRLKTNIPTNGFAIIKDKEK